MTDAELRAATSVIRGGIDMEDAVSEPRPLPRCSYCGREYADWVTGRCSCGGWVGPAPADRSAEEAPVPFGSFPYVEGECPNCGTQVRRAAPSPGRDERTVSLEEAWAEVERLRAAIYEALDDLRAAPGREHTKAVLRAALAQRDREETAMTDDADKLAADLHSTTDAMRWTTEFLRLYPNGTDADTMLGWFANAIETGRMAGASEAQRPVEAAS